MGEGGSTRKHHQGLKGPNKRVVVVARQRQKSCKRQRREDSLRTSPSDNTKFPKQKEDQGNGSNFHGGKTRKAREEQIKRTVTQQVVLPEMHSGSSR